MMFIMGKVPVFGTSTHTLDISQLGYVFVVVLCSQTVNFSNCKVEYSRPEYRSG